MDRHAPRRPMAAALLALVVLAAGAACGSPAGEQDAAADSGDGSLVFARTSRGVTDLDPTADELATNNAYTLDKIFEPLVELREDGSIEPFLAESYEVADDGLSWTFTLRDGVAFTDGSALDAEDVVFTLNRHLDVGGALPLSAPITDVTAADDRTVVVALSEPYAPLLADLATFANVILPTDLGGLTEEEFFQDPVGTGPFTVDSWDRTTGEITLAANDTYWQGAPSVDEVVFTVVDDDNQLLQQLQAGQVDVIDAVPAANVAELEANPDVQVNVSDSWQQGLLAFNTVDGAFADVRLRRAVASALDREAIAAATTYDTATPATTFLPPSIQFSAQDTDVLGYDPAAARDELARSDHPDGLSTTLIVESSSASQTQQAQAIQAALAEIGVTVEIETLDATTFWARFGERDYDLAVTWAISDTGDPSNLVRWQLLPDVADSYHTGYGNAEVIDLAAQGVAATDDATRADVYARIQRIAADEVPTVPLTYIPTITATGSGVEGLVVLPNGTTRLQDVTGS
ncbi:ABC transporter substrate-binding protein [Streptomyces radicis]|uniref:ABC transporter substrate-binding protein n=1 Tax=Streptomyces radicis TaxID=1750517 RepID=A0A3A9WII7_9ACTN|nr:ABC transporter substrate-binding protein [Streptomyces radicis]RKN12838.1 ABC transporter substrate-binding protein [Streptomyces radicis]RKN27397.1 ABC transporter substrate-binding protein [Streptomyces radicis]